MAKDKVLVLERWTPPNDSVPAGSPCPHRLVVLPDGSIRDQFYMGGYWDPCGAPECLIDFCERERL